MQIREGGLGEPQVEALLQLHFAGMLANSPKDSCHFLDFSGLAAPDVSFWTLWEGETLLGMGALREIEPSHGEIKSMRTAPDQLRRGAGATMLRHIIQTARERGWSRLSLETGRGPAFEPATEMYLRHGFEDCAAFADYPSDDPFSRFMTLNL